MELFSRLLMRPQCLQFSCDQELLVDFDGPDIMDSFICQRSATVRELARLLTEQGVVYVRGTPASGKSTLAHLLHEYNIKNRIDSVFIKQWPKPDYPVSGVDYLQQAAHGAGFTSVTALNCNNVDMTFIIDNAQTTYHDDGLWIGPLKDQHTRRFGSRYCLFVSYGSPTEGADDISPYSGRSDITTAQSVSIAVSRFQYSPQISLFFNREEFDDVLQCKRSDRKRPLPLDSHAADYLFDLTNGHPGAVIAVLDMIYEKHRSFLIRGKITEVTKDQILNILDDDKGAFDFLLHTFMRRSFPNRKNVTTDAQQVLQQVLKNGSIPRNLENIGIKDCYQRGWIHSELLDEETEEIVCVFPTRLHAKFVEKYLTRTQHAFPLKKFPTVEDLAEAVLREFSPKNLSLDTRLGTGATVRPVESCYQDEFYRSLHEVLGFASHVRSEWSGNGDGRIDFRITAVGWGIEILRDGDRLGEHCRRFVGNGSYTGWIQKGWLKDWLIIDCRSTRPRPYRVANTKLWRAVFKDDYSSIEVLDASNRVVIPRFILTH